MSVGWDVKWCPVSRITPHWHAKDRFTGWLLRSPGKLLQNFKTDYIKLIVAAVTWLNYCRYGVKRYPINQSVILLSKEIYLNGKVNNIQSS